MRGPAIVGFVLLLCGAAAATDAGRGDGKRLDRWLGDEAGVVEPLPGLTAQPAGRLLARTALETTSVPTIRRYRVRPRGGDPFDVALLDVEVGGRTRRLGVGVRGSGAVVGPVLFDDHGDLVTDADAFLAQFRGARGLRLTDASLDPIGETIALRDRLAAMDEPPPKRDERLRWALLRHRGVMFEGRRRYLAARAALENPGELRALLRGFQDEAETLHVLAGRFGGLLEPREIGAYRERAAELGDAARGALQRLDSNHARAAAAIVKKDLKQSCGHCHGYDKTRSKVSFEKLFAKESERLGWKRGVFVVGVDVDRADLEPDEAQRLASAVKAGLLLAADRL